MNPTWDSRAAYAESTAPSAISERLGVGLDEGAKLLAELLDARNQWSTALAMAGAA